MTPTPPPRAVAASSPDFICVCGFPARTHGGREEWAPQDHKPTPMFPVVVRDEDDDA